MAKFSEHELPETVKNKCIVAAEPNSVFKLNKNTQCFLSVTRGNLTRRLSLTNIKGGWLNNWFFLAEDI